MPGQSDIAHLKRFQRIAMSLDENEAAEQADIGQVVDELGHPEFDLANPDCITAATQT